MWRRLRTFYRHWSDREEELQLTPGTPREVSDAISFQFGLVGALGRAQGWILDNHQVTELENLTLGSLRERVAGWHWGSPVNVTLNILFDGRLQANVNQRYFMDDLKSLRAKLAQFPRGTRFRINTFGPQEQLAPLISAINETAQRYGFSLERGKGNKP
ncbi:MAG: hypothetical protein ACE5JX_02535 [Acidobacteriota bacterium]